MNYKFNFGNECAKEIKSDCIKTGLFGSGLVLLVVLILSMLSSLSTKWFFLLYILVVSYTIKEIIKSFKNGEYKKYLEDNIKVQDMVNNSKECCAYCGRGYYDSGCSFRCEEDDNKYHLNYTEDVFTIPTHHVCDKFTYSEQSTWWYYQALDIHSKHIENEKIKQKRYKEKDLIAENSKKLKEKYCN